MSIAKNEKGTCPHCKTPNRFEGVKYHTGSYINDLGDLRLINGKKDTDTKKLYSCKCTECGEIILFLENQMIYPLGSSRLSAPKEVPLRIATDFNEACLVELISSKASATLARRCLQNILHERGIKKRNLSEEIDEIMKTLPPYLSEAIDAVRNIGNFAAHPIKSTSTGEIVDVEEGETEWILDVLEQLFDLYYVQPAITQAKKDKLNTKLSATGQPNMK